MSFTRQRPLARLEVDDYFVGTDGETIWKVLRKREDGYVGITNKAGEKVIVKPEHTATNVTQVIYDYDSPEDMEAAGVQRVKDAFQAVIVARKIEPSDWQMPSLHEMYDMGESRTLRAHLMLAHNVRVVDLPEDLEHGDLCVIHHGHHLRDTDHTHEEN